eukprot:g15147.t1
MSFVQNLVDFLSCFPVCLMESRTTRGNHATYAALSCQINHATYSFIMSDQGASPNSYIRSRVQRSRLFHNLISASAVVLPDHSASSWTCAVISDSTNYTLCNSSLTLNSDRMLKDLALQGRAANVVQNLQAIQRLAPRHTEAKACLEDLKKVGSVTLEINPQTHRALVTFPPFLSRFCPAITKFRIFRALYQQPGATILDFRFEGRLHSFELGPNLSLAEMRCHIAQAPRDIVAPALKIILHEGYKIRFARDCSFDAPRPNLTIELSTGVSQDVILDKLPTSTSPVQFDEILVRRLSGNCDGKCRVPRQLAVSKSLEAQRISVDLSCSLRHVPPEACSLFIQPSTEISVRNSSLAALQVDGRHPMAVVVDNCVLAAQFSAGLLKLPDGAVGRKVLFHNCGYHEPATAPALQNQVLAAVPSAEFVRHAPR